MSQLLDTQITGTLSATGPVTFGSTLGVTGTITAGALSVTGAATVGGALAVTGGVTFASTLGVTGAITGASFNGLTVTPTTGGVLTVPNGITLNAGPGGTLAAAAFAALPAFEATTASTAGTTALTMGATVRAYRGRATISAGSGAFIRNLALPTTGRVAGDSADLVLKLPASANPTVNVRNADGAGTILFTIDGDAAKARNFAVCCVFNELGAWELWNAQENSYA